MNKTNKTSFHFVISPHAINPRVITMRQANVAQIATVVNSDPTVHWL